VTHNETSSKRKFYCQELESETPHDTVEEDTPDLEPWRVRLPGRSRRAHRWLQRDPALPSARQDPATRDRDVAVERRVSYENACRQARA